MENETNLSTAMDESAPISPSKHTSMQTSMNELDDAFSYDGYQVVRGEFFSHIYEPSITFNNNKVYLNTACLKKLPEVEYVQILINAEDKKLAVRPSNPNERDSFRWCSINSIKRKPKYMTCRIFFAKVFQMMEWNPDYRYKLLGKLIKSGDEYLFIFDLSATEIYKRYIDGEKTKTSRIPMFPAEWQNQFGLPIEEHRKLLQVNIFKGYTVFGVKNRNSKKTLEDTHSNHNEKGV